MKKFVVFILIILAFMEGRDHPSIAPYVDSIKQSIMIKAMSTVEISKFGELPPKLGALRGKILTHELDYAISHLKTATAAKLFWQNNCEDVQLAHSVLTSYAKKEICTVIAPYLPTHNT